MNSEEHAHSDEAQDAAQTPPHFLGTKSGDDPAACVYTGCVPENPPYTSPGIGEAQIDAQDGTGDAIQEQERPLTEAEKHLSVLEEQVRLAGRDGDIPPQALATGR
jgi:hypothetical protein